jgi:hypothetical protein
MDARCEEVRKLNRLAELRRLHGRQADPMAEYRGCWDRSERVPIACAIRAHSRHRIHKAVHRMLCFLNLDWEEQSPTGSEPVLYATSAHLLFLSVAHSAGFLELPRPNIGPLPSNTLDDHVLGTNSRQNFRGQGNQASLWAENSNTVTKGVPSCNAGSTLTLGNDSRPSQIRILSPVQPPRKFFRGHFSCIG